MRRNLIMLLCLAVLCDSYAQTNISHPGHPQVSPKGHSFHFSGKIQYPALQKVYLSPIVTDKNFYSVIFNDSSEIKDQQFLFTGLINYAQPFYLYYIDPVSHNRVSSDIFFLQAGEQSTIISSLIDEVKVRINYSVVNDEFLDEYIPAMSPFGKAWEKAFNDIDSVNEVYNDKMPDSILFQLKANEKEKKYQLDIFLLKYVQHHPHSYVALWKLVQKFSILGYDPIYQRIYNAFAPSIKDTKTGVHLSKSLKAASLTALGNKFPYFAKLNLFDRRAPTLLDFWYSRCAPCIAQFPALKEIYKKYKERNFEIVSISTDQAKDKDNWIHAIAVYELYWKHYLDTNGRQSKLLGINSFPTNFLLDANGKIIAKNISTGELDLYLKNYYSKEDRRIIEQQIWPGIKFAPGFSFRSLFPGHYEEKFILTRDHIKLHGLLFKSNAAKGLVFYLHGSNGGVNVWGKIAPTYTSLGYDFFVLDYRGYGKSEGKNNDEQQLFNDVQDVYNYMKQSYSEDKVVIIGQSIGTGPAAWLAANNHPQKLILQAPYYSLTDWIQNLVPGIDTSIIRYKLNTFQYIQQTKAPITIFHGDVDEAVYYGSSIKLKDFFKQGDELITLPGEGHNDFTNNKDYLRSLKLILK